MVKEMNNPETIQEEPVNNEQKSSPKQPHYVWPPEAQFSIRGDELEYLVGTLQQYLSTEKAREVFAMAQVMSILSKTLEKGIEDGTVKDLNA